MTTIYLIRHGESTTNLTLTVAGHYNPDLTDKGVMQSNFLINFFEGKNISKIYSSDLTRCVKTVEPIANKFNLPILKQENLREIYCGDWEGKFFKDIPVLFKDDYLKWTQDLSSYRYPNGESYIETAKRITDAVKEICENNKNESVIIATHGDSLKAFIALNYLKDLKKINDLDYLPNCSVTIVEYENGNFNFKEIGHTSHLGDSVTNLPKFNKGIF